MTVTRASTTTAGGNFTNTFDVAIAAGIPAGHRVVVFIYSNTAMSTLAPAVVDSYGNTYSACILNDIVLHLAVCDSLLAFAIPVGGHLTVNIPGSGGANGAGAVVYDISTASGSTGANASGTAGQTNNISHMTATTTGALTGQDVVLTFGVFDNTSTFVSYGGGFTGLDNFAAANSYPYIVVSEWKTQSSGTATGDFTITAASFNDTGTTVVAYATTSVIPTPSNRIGIWSKDGVLACGAFDVGIPINYGLYDDDFVAQFSGTTVGATVTGVTSVPAGLFSKDATLIGAFDA